MLSLHSFDRLDEGEVEFVRLERRWEAATEFPLLAWSTTLGFSLSTLEAYLDAAVVAAASLAKQPVPAKSSGAKIDDHLRRLARLGARVRLNDELAARLHALRRVRNALTHELAVEADTVDVCLTGMLDPWDGGLHAPAIERLVPTERLVLYSLETVEATVSWVEYALAELAERTGDFSSWTNDAWRRSEREATGRGG